MSFEENDENINDFRDPEFYISRINELDQRYKLTLNELVNNYPNHSTDQKNIEKVQNDLFLLKNEIYNNIKSISDNISISDSKIKKMKKETDELKKSYDEMVQKSGGAKGFMKDSHILYNQYLMGNCLIGFVSISSIIFYYTHMKKS
jgi:chromosome condensin MukBEF ATPase and DNA-binding subunit MukB